MFSLTLLCGFAVTTQSVAVTQAERLNEDWWKARHEHCKQITQQGGVELAFLGDSITQGWEGGGKATWDRYYGTRRAANFGFSGDRTEHVLWRLAHGELIGLKPKVIVIMIGTNNIGHGSSDSVQTAAGVKMIVRTLRKGIPNAKILLLNIFPRGADSKDAMRVAVADASARWQSLSDGKHVFCEDVGHFFLNRDGTMRSLLVPDFLHPNSAGYGIWAKAMEPKLAELLGEPANTFGRP